MEEIFISYSRKDMAQVEHIAFDLHNLNLSYWMDKRNLRVGEIWTTEIPGAIDACKVVLLFVSINSMASDNVRDEIQLAKEKKKRIMPVRLDDVQIPPEFQLLLAGIQMDDQRDVEWKNRILVAMRKPSSDSFIVHEDTEDKNNESPSAVLEAPHKTKLSPSDPGVVISRLSNAIEMFERDFIYPNECDLVVTELNSLANHLVFDYQIIHIQYALDKKISELVVQVMEFRKICLSGTSQSEEARKQILHRLHRMIHEL